MGNNFKLLLHVLAAFAACNLQLSVGSAQSGSFSLLTITNPPQATNAGFGIAVAPLGSDRFLVGAPFNKLDGTNVGAVYLYNSMGTLLATITNPAPSQDDKFGMAVASVGLDCLVVGAYTDDAGALDTGVAYLFNTNGTLMTTFTNPTPAIFEYFGYSVASVGSEMVVIGAYNAQVGSINPGAAYLFRTNGVLLATFSDPHSFSTITPGDCFGWAVVGVGIDRVLVGARQGEESLANAGAAYLFRTDGTLIKAIANPAPAALDWFGSAVATVGSDRLLIGAEGDGTGAMRAGSAYLFNTNGTLLTVFTNPTPVANEYFGYSVAAFGTDQLLIGAYCDSGPGTAVRGEAYLYGTDGKLTMTITNPTPAAFDFFGYSFAALGTNQFVVGANCSEVYLYTREIPTSDPPRLNIYHTITNTIAITWPSSATNWILQESADCMTAESWTNTVGVIQDNGPTKTLLIETLSRSRFFRMFKP